MKTKVIHHIEYMPSGELFAEQRDYWHTPYRFNGKELDEETGYYYYGARYYTPEYGIWLSVDPLSDKYPSMSAFMYCAGNPVIYIDPDGRDIWTIFDDGTIKREKDTSVDRIDVVDKENNTTKGTESKYGTIKQHTVKDKSNKIDYFDIKGDDLAKETFENIANNTSIEWTHAKIGEEASGRNIVGTSHSENSTSVGHYLRRNNYTLKEVNHNHPNGTVPSKVDIKNAELYLSKFPNIRLNVYTKQNGYTPYDNKQYYSKPVMLEGVTISAE